VRGNELERGEGGAGTVLYVGAGGESGSFLFEGRRRRRSNDFFWILNRVRFRWKSKRSWAHMWAWFSFQASNGLKWKACPNLHSMSHEWDGPCVAQPVVRCSLRRQMTSTYFDLKCLHRKMFPLANMITHLLRC
jgi:hypothetical protein